MTIIKPETDEAILVLLHDHLFFESSKEEIEHHGLLMCLLYAL
jgi:hypothetical protein